MNHPPVSSTHHPNQVPSAAQESSTASANLGKRKRAKSSTPEDSTVLSAKGEGPALQPCTALDTEDDAHTFKRTKASPASQGSPASFSESPIDESKKTDDVNGTTVDDSANRKLMCISCSDDEDVTKLVKVSCVHYYCHNCLEAYVRSSLDSQGIFPPSCCRLPFAFRAVADNVSANIFHLYCERQAESQDKNKFYCAAPKCSVRIPSERIKDERGKCPACAKVTCTKCKGQAPIDPKEHHECNEDLEREIVLGIAKKEGWQTCYNCGHIVCLTFGCHHMM